MFDNIMNIITVVSLLVGFLSVILTVVFYYKGQRKLELSWLRYSYQIVENRNSRIPMLELLYNGKPVEELSVTKLAIWNSGNKEIRNTDIYEDKHICINTGNSAKILEALIISSNIDDKFSIKTDKNVLFIDFECIEREDGLIIQLIHTGKGRELIVDGKIKGGAIRPCEKIEQKNYKVYKIASYTYLFLILYTMMDRGFLNNNAMKLVLTLLLTVSCAAFLYLRYKFTFHKTSISMPKYIANNLFGKE